MPTSIFSTNQSVAWAMSSISEVIVPLIKERARAGKKVFISTHDANIAVRTLPYSSVYRARLDHDGYKTYVGNPFTNLSLNAHDPGDHLDWRTISMRTLEGGPAAFGERGKIYGTQLRRQCGMKARSTLWR